MKKELTDLIPVYGIVRVSKRMDRELEGDGPRLLRGDISRRDFHCGAIKRLAYFTGLALWNYGFVSMTPKAIYGASELIDKLN